MKILKYILLMLKNLKVVMFARVPIIDDECEGCVKEVEECEKCIVYEERQK